MSPSHPQPARSNRNQRPTWVLLKRWDQAVVGAAVMVALVLMGVYWVAQGGLSGRLIELDRAQPSSVAFELDINSADWPELSVLPNIGETLAKRIVESRQSDGPFADVDDLQRVRGIGPKTLEQIRPYLRPLPPSGNVAGQ
jgi:competence protein ComEA